MIKFIIIFLVLAVFASQNFESVEVRFIFGPEVEMPVIMVMMIGFVAGYIYSFISLKLKFHRKMNELEDEEP